MPHRPELYLGATRTLRGTEPERLLLPAHHLVTQGVVVGMTGSGKTGLLTVLVEEALRASIPALIIDVKGDLPNLLLSHVGSLQLNAFFGRRQRASLAASLNTLLASPTFASWREGVTLDIASWLTPKRLDTGGQLTPAVILSVAHLDDDERALVLGVVLEEYLTWVRSLPGSRRLRALLVFDEVYGFLPPYPATPKRVYHHLWLPKHSSDLSDCSSPSPSHSSKLASAVSSIAADKS